MPGNDELHGGGADDGFYFGNDSGIDVILDFSAGDTISIRANVNGSNAASFTELTITANPDGGRAWWTWARVMRSSSRAKRPRT